MLLDTLAKLAVIDVLPELLFNICTHKKCLTFFFKFSLFLLFLLVLHFLLIILVLLLLLFLLKKNLFLLFLPFLLVSCFSTFSCFFTLSTLSKFSTSLIFLFKKKTFQLFCFSAFLFLTFLLV